MAAERKKCASPSGPGDTISQFAADVGETSPVIRSAVRNGLIQAFEFNGVLRIPPSEKQKYVETWGKKQSA
jgi:hypothetical protein